MSATRDSFAYRCLPLDIANTHGWELLCPARFSVTWSGEPDQHAIQLEGEGAAIASSHFGDGILTFHVGHLFRTEPEFNLWISGPVNAPKDGISALTGIVETDWSPFTFTMNWAFTRAGATVVFERDEPFCAFFPIARNLLPAFSPELCAIEDDPDLHADYLRWTRERSEFLQNLPIAGTAANELRWQRTYLGPRCHAQRPQTRLRLRPFRHRDRSG
jgi:hypothetical protein